MKNKTKTGYRLNHSQIQSRLNLVIPAQEFLSQKLFKIRHTYFKFKKQSMNLLKFQLLSTSMVQFNQKVALWFVHRFLVFIFLQSHLHTWLKVKTGRHQKAKVAFLHLLHPNTLLKYHTFPELSPSTENHTHTAILSIIKLHR